MDQPRYVVAKDGGSYWGETLGYLISDEVGGFVRIGVLFAPGRGPAVEPLTVALSDCRTATAEDFDRFRVSRATIKF